MSFQTSVGALAASMAFAANAQTPPQRVEWLPMFGPVINTPCTTGPLQGRRPGELIQGHAEQKGKYIWAVGNTCEYSAFRTDPETGLPAEFVSRHEMGTIGIKPPSRPLAGAAMLQMGWWRETGIFNQQPQKVSVVPGINATCHVTVGNTAPVQLPHQAVIIPDSRHAYFLRSGCSLELMIKMPDQAITVSGGGVRNPGNVSLPPATTPAGNYINPSGFGEPVINALFNLLGRLTDLMPAYRKDNCVILTYGMDKADTTRRAHNLTPEQAGIAAPAFANETPQEKAERCEEERTTAINTCTELLKGTNPPIGVAGPKQTMEQCVRGQISADCGGNSTNIPPRTFAPRR